MKWENYMRGVRRRQWSWKHHCRVCWLPNTYFRTNSERHKTTKLSCITLFEQTLQNFHSTLTFFVEYGMVAVVPETSEGCHACAWAHHGDGYGGVSWQVEARRTGKNDQSARKVLKQHLQSCYRHSYDWSVHMQHYAVDQGSFPCSCFVTNLKITCVSRMVTPMKPMSTLTRLDSTGYKLHNYMTCIHT